MDTISTTNPVRTQGEIMTSHFKTFGKAQVSAFVGGIIDYLLMIMCIEIFHFHLISAIITGGVIGAIVNFIINRHWTFKRNNDKLLWQLSKFILMAMSSILLKAFGTYFLTNVLGISYKIVRLLVDGLVCFGFNFFVQKLWVFKSKTLLSISLLIVLLFLNSQNLTGQISNNQIHNDKNNVSNYISDSHEKKDTIATEQLSREKEKNNIYNNLNSNTENIKHQTSRYILGESAFGLKKGEVMYQNVEFILNSFSYGITDHFMINATFEPFSLFSGESTFFIINPKYTFQDADSDINFGIGHNFLFEFGKYKNKVRGVAYGLVSFGTPLKNFTIAVGYEYENNPTDKNTPVVQLSGVLPISKKFSIMIESFLLFYVKNELYFTPNIRYVTKKTTIDLGLFVGGGLNDHILPVFSVSTKF